jgi:hypothetical protein
MPITVSLPSRNVELEFPDSMTEQEIQQAIDKEYPRSGQDVAFEVDQATQQSVEGGNLVNAIDQLSNDDFIMMNNHLAKKKSSLGDAFGVFTESIKNLSEEVGTGIGAAAYNVAQGNVSPVYESTKQGLVAGTVGLVDIANKILSPIQEIPSKEEFLKQTKDQPLETIADESSPFGRKQVPNTEQDYIALVERRKADARDALNRTLAIEATLRGAPIEEVARMAQNIDPGLLTGGASALIRGGAKTLFKAGAKAAAQAGAQTGIQTAGRVAASTAPGPIKQAALTAVETGAAGAQLAGSLPGRAIQAVGDVAENILPGTGAPVKAVSMAGTMLSSLGLDVMALAATEKAAEVVKGVARAAKGEASRVGPLEQVAMNPSVSPAARKLAAGLAQVQPIFGTAGRIAGQALKEAGVGAAVGAGLGYLAERNLEGAAAAAGAGTVFGGATGVFRGTFRAGREALGYSTERTARQATGDINSFIAERPEMEQAAWAQTMDRLAQNIGPEKAAAQADALRIAEANGSKVRLATPDETKQWQNPGWLNIDGNGQEIVLNPQQILGDTAAHETAHVLFASTLNRAFRPEIETAIFGTVDPVNGEIIRPGLFSDPDLAKVADQIADSYGNNTTASNEFRGYANRLRNTTDAAALSESRTRIADELTATYTGKLFGRLRAGRFNPDRLPLVYRRVLNGIEDSIVDKLRTTLFEQGMDLGFNAARGAFTDAKGRLVRIPELDAIIKKAMQPSRKAAAQAKVKGKPDLIPTNPVDRAIWARSYGGARGILNDDLTPKSVAQMEQEKVARWQDMTSRLSALPESERTGIQFSRDAKGNTVMTAKGQLSDAAINQILSSKAFDQSSVAVLREVLTSLQNFEKATFDTRYYGVYDRGRGGSKMVAGVKSASPNEILPYSVEANSQQGVIIRAVDMTAVRDRLMTALKKPQFKDLYSNGGEAIKDFRAYLTNLTNINAVPSDIMFGGGPKGAQKRNLFYDALGFRLRNNETLLNAPADVISKSQNTIKSYRVERFAKLVDSGERLAFEEATTFERAMKNFQPSAFVRETLPNGETLTNPDGYRILKKTGGKLFRVYDDNGALLGTSSSEDAAMKKAQSDYAKKQAKEEPAIKRFQPITPEHDAAFLRAAQAGDTATAQKMVDEAAKKAGYNVGPVWHGGNAGFNKFSFEKMGEQGTAEGKGFYFTNKEDIAKGYVKESNGRLMRVMLKSGDRLNGQKVTITRSQLGKIIDIIDPRGEDFLANYGDVTFEGRNKVKSEAISNLLNYSDSDVDLIAGMINSGVPAEKVYDVIEKVAGKFGIKEKATWGGEGHEINIATSPKHIKLADPITYDDAGNIIPLSQRFNVESPDIRFQPDSASPSILNGSNGTRIIKSPSGKFRVYSAAGALLGIRDTEEAAKKLATK